MLLLVRDVELYEAVRCHWPGQLVTGKIATGPSSHHGEEFLVTNVQYFGGLGQDEGPLLISAPSAALHSEVRFDTSPEPSGTELIPEVAVMMALLGRAST